MAVLYGNDAFPISLSAKKGTPKGFCFPENLFEISNGGLFWKSLVPFLRRIYALSVGFKLKPLRKSVFQC